jgi:hypothetical protein
MNTQHWIIGLDPDTTRFLQLTWALRRLGFKMRADWDTRDLAKLPMSSPDGGILVLAESPEGLSVQGPSDLIARLKETYESLLHPDSTL